MKKVIIAYAPAGAGHFKAAEAVHEYLSRQRQDTQPVLVDILTKTNPLFQFTYIQGYHLLIHHFVLIWKWLFWVTAVWSKYFFARQAITLANTVNALAFEHFLVREQPDYIVSTHFLTSEISADLKNKGRIKSVLITVITDFGVHPFWVCGGTDIYFAASEYTKQRLIESGVEEKRIKVSGIPVSEKFLGEFDRPAILRKLRLNPDKFTVLVITGSFGIGPIEEIAENLAGACQLIVVCAKNTGLYDRLSAKGHPDCLVLGFAGNMEELMAISDVIITKPGGLSTSESLVMGLVPIFISPIPGQEMENIKAMQSFGIGFYPSDTGAIRGIVIELRDNPEKLKAMKEKIARIKKPGAVRDICDVIR